MERKLFAVFRNHTDKQFKFKNSIIGDTQMDAKTILVFYKFNI